MFYACVGMCVVSGFWACMYIYILVRMYVYSLNEIKSYSALSRAEHRVTRPDYGLPLSSDSHEPADITVIR